MTITWRPGVRARTAADLADALDRVLGPLPGHFVAQESYRSPARSATLHAAYTAGQGPRAAAANTSAHNVDPARAVDLQLVEGNPHGAGLRAVWDYHDPRWRALVAAVDAAPDVHSLDTIGDTDHVETPRWWATTDAVEQGVRPAGVHLPAQPLPAVVVTADASEGAREMPGQEQDADAGQKLGDVRAPDQEPDAPPLAP